jgi:hypothetical protein
VNARGCIRIQQDVPILQLLGFGPVLEVLLQAVLALAALAHGRDGSLVNDGRAIVGRGGGHGDCDEASVEVERLLMKMIDFMVVVVEERICLAQLRDIDVVDAGFQDEMRGSSFAYTS